MIQVKKPEDVPYDHHYAVLIYKTDSVFIPGDERSRTNPGHGYPERTETFTTFEHWVTKDKDVWESFVKALDFKSSRTYNKEPFVFFEVVARGRLEKSVTLKV